MKYPHIKIETLIIVCTALAMLRQTELVVAAEPPLPVREMSGSYAFNLRDDKVNVGNAHNVFLAKIVRNMGLVPQPPPARGGEAFPVTLFQVEVMANVKGNLHGQVLVRQLGGVKDGVYYRVHSDTLDPDASGLLKVGATYLLSTGSSLTNNQNATNLLGAHFNQRTLISTNAALDNAQLLQLAQPRITQLREAYIDEDTTGRGGRGANPRNSFSALSSGEQQQIRTEVEQSKAAIERARPSP